MSLPKSHGQLHNHCHAGPIREVPVVRIGAVRVRLSAVSPHTQSNTGTDCCCGVPWPSTTRSRIPLPATSATTHATNSRSIFSRGVAPVYRTTLEWRQRAPTGCFSRDTDTGRLIPDQDTDTLDRLSKFRFCGGDRDRGRGAKRNPPHKKKPRSSDKTERLRELTEKLKSPSAGRSEPPTSVISASENVSSGSGSVSNNSVSVPATPPPTQPVQPPPPPPPEDDLFECVNLKLPKPESRTIVGSYIQRTIPFRSASFSQVDFSSVDGKYIRTGKSPSTSSKIPSLASSNVSLTLPRKKPPDPSSSQSSLGSSINVIDASESSNPSLDSAVGSSEWLFPKSNSPLQTETHAKPPNLRSLTHPLTRRALSTEESVSVFGLIEGSGSAGLEGLREESDTDSAAASEPEQRPPSLTVTHTDNTDTTISNSQQSADDSQNKSVTIEQPNTTLTDNKSDTIETNPAVECVNSVTGSSEPSQTFVAKWPDENTQTSGEVKSILTDLSHLKEVEIVSPTITEESNLNVIKLENNKTDEPVKTTLVESETVASPLMTPDVKVENDVKHRWSDEVTNEWPSSAQEEPQSPDDAVVRPSWPRGGDRRWLERPRLVCQSSEERDDEGSSPRRFNTLVRNDSLSEGESDPGDRRAATPTRDGTASPSIFPPSDQSDTENRLSRSPHNTRRYSKRPLRGPYGQMLEAEMKKPDANRKFSKLQYNDELKFLENYSQTNTLPAKSSNRPRATDDCHLKRSYTSPDSPSLDPRTSPKRKVSANIPYSAPNPPTSASEGVPVVHIRTTSSPSQLEGCSAATKPQPSPQLLAQLLKGSSERACAPPPVSSPSPSPSPTTINHHIKPHHWKDTRTHVVVELYDTERSYVESLKILVMKYLQPLKSPENAGLVDAAIVDEIFYQVPAILAHHEEFLEELKNRLEHWDVKQRVGDIFLETFTRQSVIDTYTAFINNWKNAKEAIKSTSQAKPAFARFLEAMAREHKGKLALDSLLIMPVQRIPRYELLIQTLLKHTEPSHPDHGPLCEAQREVHALAVRINCTERDSLELEQLEALIEGGSGLHLAASERSFLRHDLVTMASSQGRKERALFLFSDLLIITSIKRRSGTIRKPSMNSPGSIASTLEANKYKLLMRIPLDDLEVVKEKDENVRRQLREMEHLREDVAALGQMTELVAALHCPHSQIETDIRDMHSALSKQLAERQSSDSQLSYLELMLNTQSGVDNLSVIFSKPDKRSSWEETFTEAKQRLALSTDKRLTPEFVAPVPIRKTRAGLQFTCAAPTLGSQDVWVCNSDGYVGQVCVLSLSPEPTVTSCNGVCNARILCITAVPAVTSTSTSTSNNTSQVSHGARLHQLSLNSNISISVEDTDKADLQLESSCSSSSDEDGEGGEEVAESGGGGGGGGELSEDCDHLQPTMWLGTEDGCIHVYNSSDNIRIKKNKIKIQHCSSVHSIIYLDNRVFVALANGDICVYMRDSSGVWDTSHPFTVTVGSVASPVSRMVPIADKLWCSCHNMVKVLNISTLAIEHQFSGSGETQRSISCLAVSGLSVWLSLQHSAVVRLFHASTYDCLAEINIAPSVTKMLASCDDIIRQHKAACLRVTSLLACQELLWVGTSAGVILTLPLPHVSSSTTKISPSAALQVTGRSKCVPHGHTGHVRFLTAVENKPLSNHSHETTTANNSRLLVISGGDGYEDFRSASISEVAGREDSTNHLLLWQT